MRIFPSSKEAILVTSEPGREVALLLSSGLMGGEIHATDKRNNHPQD
jgi:hypothetical protein